MEFILLISKFSDSFSSILPKDTTKSNHFQLNLKEMSSSKTQLKCCRNQIDNLVALWLNNICCLNGCRWVTGLCLQEKVREICCNIVALICSFNQFFRYPTLRLMASGMVSVWVEITQLYCFKLSFIAEIVCDLARDFFVRGKVNCQRRVNFN